MSKAKEILEELNKFNEEEQGEDLDEILVDLSDIYNSIEDEELRNKFLSEVKSFADNYRKENNIETW